MFRYGVNCALEPVAETAPVALRGEIKGIARDAASLGYSALELFIRDPAQYRTAQLNAAARENGLSFCFIATGMEYTLTRLCLTGGTPAGREAAVRRLFEHIDLAAELHCGVIVGIMRGQIPEPGQAERCFGELAGAMRRLGEHAGKSGVPLVIEAITRYINNYLCSVPETAEFVRSLALPGVGVHIDSHSMNVEDRDIAASVCGCGELLGYVHFSDSNRAYPGGGRFDFKTLMNALYDIDYRGYITVECQPYPGPVSCARRGIEYMRALEALLAVERAPLRDLSSEKS